jgi:hypothetical protein
LRWLEDKFYTPWASPPNTLWSRPRPNPGRTRTGDAAHLGAKATPMGARMTQIWAD